MEVPTLPPTGWRDDQKAYRLGLLHDDNNAITNTNHTDILDFYHGRISVHRNQDAQFMIHTILTTWAKDDFAKLNDERDFMYWLFPTRVYRVAKAPGDDSGNNNTGDVGRDPNMVTLPIPTLPTSPQALHVLRHDPIVQRGLIRAWEMMLLYYGFILGDDDIGNVVAPPSPQSKSADGREYDDAMRVAQYNHLVDTPLEWARVTRILQSLGDLGFERFKSPWLYSMVPLVFGPPTSTSTALRPVFWQQWIPTLRRRRDRLSLRHLVRTHLRYDPKNPPALHEYPLFDEDVDATNDVHAVDAGPEGGAIEWIEFDKPTTIDVDTHSLVSMILDLPLLCDLRRLEMHATHIPNLAALLSQLYVDGR